MKTTTDRIRSVILPGPLFVHETAFLCMVAGQNIGETTRLFAAERQKTFLSWRPVAIGMPRFVVVAGGPAIVSGMPDSLLGFLDKRRTIAGIWLGREAGESQRGPGPAVSSN
jgi:hypothetical protein